VATYPREPVRTTIGGENFVSFRNTNVDGQTRSGRIGGVLTRLILSKTDDFENPVGCVVFFLDLITKQWWRPEGEQPFGSDELLHYSLANLLPYLELDSGSLLNMFDHGSMCLEVTFCPEQSGFTTVEKTEFKIQTHDGFYSTARSIVFPNGYNEKEARKKVLKILGNYRTDFPTTNMSFEKLQASIPITKKELLGSVMWLKEDEAVEILTSPSDPDTIISLKIRSKGMAELDGSLNRPVEYPHMVKNVFGPNFESTTHGSNSPIINQLDNRSTFDAVRQRLESENTPNKEEIGQVVTELEKEISNPTSLDKINESTSRLRKIAGWAFQMVSGLVQQVVAQIIAGQIKLPNG